MKEHEIVAAVRESAGLHDQDEAERAVRATLSVLGRRLAGGETGDLAAQLPPALAEVLTPEGPGERFDVEEFYRRVGEEEGADARDARRHARAVLAAIRAGVAGGELNHLSAQLPPDYDDLLGTDPVQHH